MKRTFLAAALLLAACTPLTQTSTPACAAPLKSALQVDLYFGRGSAGREVSEAEWASFLNEEVTPRFPDGLSVFDVRGQYRNSQGTIERERSKRLTVVVFDAPSHLAKVQAIVASYSRRHGQDSVLRVEQPVCANL
ncbi:MAG: DUF3574 domain-containing protein [Reyranella sp.]|nr:DUF3574 domain-containing protein [Reyranella sp.]MBN9091651.1 DUF3574 domain-containing protein [Reyranella sp.]